MKLKINHPEPSARELAGPRYWRSLDELTAAPEFQSWLEKEFPNGASALEGSDRRGFLKIMAASFGLAGLGLSGCRQPTRHLLPYSKQPDRIIPGVPVFYSSSIPGAEEHIPLIVETHDGRPTKVEGNPSYKPYGGATNVFAQSSVLDLYDPDRAQRSNVNGAPMTPGEVMDLLNKLAVSFSGNGGAGLYFLADENNSPTRARIVTRLRARFPQAVWAEYEPIDQGNPERAATAYLGQRARPVYNFSKAKRVLSLDSDFLHTDPGNLGYARGFAQARKLAVEEKEPNKEIVDPEKMIRLYAVESNFSLTGANADHRLRCATAHIGVVAALLAAEVLSQRDATRYATLITSLKQSGAGTQVDEKWITECAKDLAAHAGASAVIAGPHLPVAVHQVVLLMNSALGAVGSTVTLASLPAQPAAASIADIAQAITDNKVQKLIILNGNPAYNAPGDLNFATKLASLGKDKIVRYGFYGPDADETSALAGTFLAGLHYLESWGDGLTWDGLYVPVQPMILPLFEGFGEIDVLAQISGDPNPDAYTYVRDTFRASRVTGSFDEWLATGITGTGFAAVTAEPAAASVEQLISSSKIETTPVNAKQLEVRFVSGMGWDGRYANNGWLQECPDPMTKLTWDNAIYVSPRLAKELNILPTAPFLSELGQVRMNDNTFVKGREIARVAEITVNGQTIRGPLSILPGLANYTLVAPLGYGRKNAGRVGSNVGFNAYPAAKFGGVGAATGAVLKLLPESESWRLANVQEHWSMEGRAIIRESNLEAYGEDHDFVKKMDVEAHSPPIYGPAKDESVQQKAVDIPRGQSLYVTPPNNKPMPNVPVWNTKDGLAKFPTPQQWGMSIDLNTCLGCTACLVACQAENNIPIVGKDQIMRGREMHWIRLDRYFASGPVKNGEGHDKYAATLELPEDPQVTFQSMACQHCELAPCENVCPFAATLHDDQGLNTMAYNRCVGTKYCANNCPYKVRRFNFFDWNKRQIGHFYEGPLGPQNYDIKGQDGTPASELVRMQKNPEVTIRMRGVMEKCTYCVQRIESAKITQRNKAKDSGDIKVPDGAIVPACAQACPTESIVFGDVSDPESEVSKAKALDRNYSVLGYLNIRPRTTYLAKLRNPNKLMPDFAAQPLSRLEYETRYGHAGAEHAAPAAGGEHAAPAH